MIDVAATYLSLMRADAQFTNLRFQLQEDQVRDMLGRWESGLTPTLVVNRRGTILGLSAEEVCDAGLRPQIMVQPR